MGFFADSPSGGCRRCPGCHLREEGWSSGQGLCWMRGFRHKKPNSSSSNCLLGPKVPTLLGPVDGPNVPPPPGWAPGCLIQPPSYASPVSRHWRHLPPTKGWLAWRGLTGGRLASMPRRVERRLSSLQVNQSIFCSTFSTALWEGTSPLASFSGASKTTRCFSLAIVNTGLMGSTWHPSRTLLEDSPLFFQGLSRLIQASNSAWACPQPWRCPTQSTTWLFPKPSAQQYRLLSPPWDRILAHSQDIWLANRKLVSRNYT